jgi:hypothetical protein
MIPLGHKKFDDFVKLCNNLDWHKYVSNDKNVNEETVKANIEVTLAILREYYNWSFSQH